MVKVITRFAIAGPADAASKDAIVSGVLSRTSDALNNPLRTFFGAPAVIRDIQSLGSGVLVGLNPIASADRGAAAAAEVAAVAAATAAADEAATTPTSADDDDLVASVELDLPLDLDITLDEEPVAETFIPPSFEFDFGSGEDPLTAAFAALNLQLPQMAGDQPRAAAPALGADPVAQQPADAAAAAAAAAGEDSSAAGLRLGQGGALMSAEEESDVAAVADKQQQQQQQQQQKRQAATVLAAPWQQVAADQHHHQQQQLQQKSQTLGYEPAPAAPPAAAAATQAATQTSKGGQQPIYTPYTPLPLGVPVDLSSLLGTTARSRRSAKPAELTAAAAMLPPSPPPAVVSRPAQPKQEQTEPQASSDVYNPWEEAADAAAYAKAPPCPFPLTKQHALVDRQGRFIGWNKGAECMFRPAAAKPAYQQQQQQQQQQQPGKTPVSWEQAPACSFAPTKENVVWDRSERGWGQEHGQSCAFRVSNA
jgi:hypothetical protein